jgi:hypothetical protein
VAIVGSAVALSYSITGQNVRLADRGQEYSQVRAAAEGALEYGYGMWRGKSSQNGRPPTVKDCTNALFTPDIDGITFSSPLSITPADQYGAPSSEPVPVLVDLQGFPGWKGRVFNYVASVEATTRTTLDGRPVTFRAKRLFQYVAVHLFQAMYFYEGDFEYYRPAKAVISGLTHTNRHGMVSNDAVKAGTLTFMSPVSYVMDWTAGDPFRATTWSGYSPGSNQRPTFQAEITQTPRLEPMGTEPLAVLDAAPTGPLSPSGQLVGPDGDSDGNPNNDSFHEIIEPSVDGFADPEAIASRRLYNKAGIVVTINGAKRKVETQNGTSLSSTQVSALQSAISTTSIYDQRERTPVRVSSLDVGAAKPVLDAAADFNGVIYIHDITPTDSATPKNAIRLKNGGTLPEDGLTVASQNAIYIQGDYNTGATAANAATVVPSNSSGNPNHTASPTATGYTRKPAAVIGDAVMLLSNSWSDENSSLSIGQRMATNTTYNTALISGVMPSGYEPGGAAPQYGYSGGANNYPRFLENWSSRKCTYFGSMVQLFASKSFTGRWDTGNIYNPPTRHWNYDPNFSENPPPGSVDAVYVTRGRWSRY